MNGRCYSYDIDHRGRMEDAIADLRRRDSHSALEADRVKRGLHPENHDGGDEDADR